jgi:hypothetical protein
VMLCAVARPPSCRELAHQISDRGCMAGSSDHPDTAAIGSCGGDGGAVAAGSTHAAAIAFDDTVMTEDDLGSTADMRRQIEARIQAEAQQRQRQVAAAAHAATSAAARGTGSAAATAGVTGTTHDDHVVDLGASTSSSVKWRTSSDSQFCSDASDAAAGGGRYDDSAAHGSTEPAAARQQQLSFELALAAVTQARLRAEADTDLAGTRRAQGAFLALADRHLARAEALLLQRGLPRPLSPPAETYAGPALHPDPVLAYRFWRLCATYASVGDARGAARMLATAGRLGLHTVGAPGELVPAQEPAITELLGAEGGQGSHGRDDGDGGADLQRLRELLRGFERAQLAHAGESIAPLSKIW